MYKCNVPIRVRYAETDQMGYVYYGNYLTYYEVARVESLRNLGISYKEIENQGILMPVVENHSKYIQPGRYDELLKVEVVIPTLPGVKIQFNYSIFNEADQLIHTGHTVLVFLGESGKVIKAPDKLLKALGPYFENEK